MARPIKRLQAEPDVMAELRRRSRSTTIGVRDRERADIILLRIQGLGVERFSADLTGDVIRAGSFASVNELIRDIKTCLAQRNANPKPYVWRAEGVEILAKIKRARAALDKNAAG